MDNTPIETKNYRKPKKSKSPLVVGVSCFVAGAVFGASVTAAFSGAWSVRGDSAATTITVGSTDAGGESGKLPGTNPPNEHKHVFGDKLEIIEEPTCTTTGIAKVYCDGCVEYEMRYIDATGHDEEVIPGYPATPTEDGLTDGVICTKCGEILEEQQVISAGSHMYDYKILTDSTCEITGVFNYTDDMVIPELLGGYTVVSIGDAAFQGRGVKIVSIPSSVKNIGSNAFNGCWVLQSISIPDDSAITSIGDKAFNNCTSLEQITLPGRLESIGSEAFLYCTRLKIVKIGPYVESIGENAFKGCDDLGEIGYMGTMAEWNAIDKASSWDAQTGEYTVYCTDGKIEKTPVLFNIEVTSETTCTITKYLYSESKVVIPEYIGGRRVTAIGEEAFYAHTWLEEVVFEAPLETIGKNAFYGCTYLKTLTIPDTVKNIDEGAFAECVSLSELTVPSSVKTIGANAFYNCTGVTKLALADGLEAIGDSAFGSCAGIPYVTIPSSVKTIGANAFAACTSLVKLTLGNGVETIGDGAFAFCNGLETLTIPDNVKSIGSTAFFDCSGLTSITLGKRVEEIGKHAFDGCDYVMSIQLPASIKSVEASAFNIKSLNGITVADGNIAYKDIGGILLSFDGKTLVRYPCGREGNYTVPDGVTVIGEGAFYGCDSGPTRDITFPASVEVIEKSAFEYGGVYIVNLPSGLKSIGESAFSNNPSLEKINYGGTVAGWQALEKGAGWHNYAGNYTVYCTDGTVGKDGTVTPNKPDNQTDFAYTAYGNVCTITGYNGSDVYVEIPEYIDGYRVTEIGEKVFCGCDFIKSVVIPEEVLTIYNNAFDGCSSLVSVTMPASVSSIGANAFIGCESLESIVIPQKTMVIGNSAFEGCYSLKRVSFVGTLNAVGERSFKDCKALADIEFGGTVAEWEYANKFDDWDGGTPDYTIYCTDGTVGKDGTVTMYK